MSYRRRFWWHPRNGEVGRAEDNPYPPDECVLSDYRPVLERMRLRFEAMCRNGWYGTEWRDIARGRKLWVQVTQ